MIENLKDLLVARYGEIDRASMFQYGKDMYRYAGGIWVSYLVEKEVEREVDFSFFVTMGEEGKAVFKATESLNSNIARFFGVNDEFLFTDYYADLLQHKRNHMNKWNASLDHDNAVIFVYGSYTVPQEIEEIYYEFAVAKLNSVELVDKVIGIKFGSIIEGADYDATPFELRFPFSQEVLDLSLENLNTEIEVEWEKNNSIYYKIMDASSRILCYAKWIAGDDEPTGTWEDSNSWLKELAIDGGNALLENDVPCQPVPNREGYTVVRDNMPE